MANALFGWVNNILSATLTADSEEAGLGVAQLQNDQGDASTAWQTAAGVTTSGFLADTGSAYSVWRAFALARTNLTSAATVQWRVGAPGTGGALASVVYDSGVLPAGVVPGFGQTVFVMFPQSLVPVQAQAQALRCDISDPTNPDGFLSVALAYAGVPWQPLTNISTATTRGRDDSTLETTTRGGQEYPLNLWARRRWSVDFQGIRNSEVLPDVDALDAACRDGGNILLVPDPASSTVNQEAVFGRGKPGSDLAYFQGAPDRRTWKLTVTERL